jgi:ferredoxin
LAKKKKKVSTRRLVQLFWAAASNSYVTGFAAGKLYQGNLKMVCAPGLNCYSCPGAVMACPIGSLQAVLGSKAFVLSTYVFGLLMLFGTVLGRMVCGFLCPFGLIQEQVYRIPFFKKVKSFKNDGWARRLKYVALILLVITLPIMLSRGQDADPYFCKYVCPAGSLEAGIPHVLYDRLSAGKQVAAPLDSAGGLSLSNALLTPATLSMGRLKVGFLYWWKISILVLTILLSLVTYRPFCKYLCPLGAFYGAFNPLSFYRLKYHENACINCSRCEKACGMGLNPVTQTNHAECVRCGDCVAVCPTGAITMGFTHKKPADRPALRGKAPLKGEQP